MVTLIWFSFTNESIIDQTYFPEISPTPLFQIPRNAGLPFLKGGQEGFNLRYLYDYGLTNNIMTRLSVMKCSGQVKRKALRSNC